MKINSIDDVATIAMEPYQALRNPHIRHLHYMRNYLDTPEHKGKGFRQQRAGNKAKCDQKKIWKTGRNGGNETL